MEESGKVSFPSNEESSSIHVFYEQDQRQAECKSSSEDSSSDSDGNGVTIRPAAAKAARQCESSSEDSSSEESCGTGIKPAAAMSSSKDSSSDYDGDGVTIRPAAGKPAKQCESSSEDSSSDEDGGPSITPSARVRARQSGNLLPPWWPISSVETEAGKRFWQTPELVDKLLLMLDAKSMLSLAEVQPLALKILQAGSQPWNKLIREALDNPFIPYVHGWQFFDQQRTLVKRIASTVLAKMESPQPLLRQLLDLICVKYNAERPVERSMFHTREPLRVQVSCPLHVSHTVTGYGFILLEDCEGTLGSVEQHLETILESDLSFHLSDFQLPSVSSRLSRQPRTMERIQFSELRLRRKDVIDTWLHVLQNCDQAEGLRYVLVYDDIGAGGWEALAKALSLHQ